MDHFSFLVEIKEAMCSLTFLDHLQLYTFLNLTKAVKVKG